MSGPPRVDGPPAGLPVRRTRTVAVAVLAAVVGIRVSVARGLEGTAADLAGDPAGALGRALDGWGSAGSLGDASAAGLRSLPLAALHRLADAVGVPGTAAQAAWTALVLVLAVVGARRLASVASPAAAGESWAPWVAALVYACGPVLVATGVDAPLDGLVAALLPWVLLPVVRRDRGWAGAARSTAWLGLAGVGTPVWSLLVLAAGLLAAVVVWRRDLRQLLRWVLLAALASTWWGVVTVWEARRATVVTDVLPDADLRLQVAQALGRPAWSLVWLLLLALAPAAVAVAGVVVARGRPERLLVGGLLGLGTLLVASGLSSGFRVPVLAPAALGGAPAALAPALALWSAAAVLAWGAVVDGLRWHLDDLVRPPRSRTQAGALLACAALVLSAAGVALAALERPTDPAAAGTQGAPADLWRDVAAWSRSAPPGRVLVLPATTGRLDPVVRQALGGRPWVGRDALPVSTPTATAALDDVLRRVSRGQAAPEVLDGLRRLGVAYVLVRDDLGAAADRRRPSGLVRAGLASGGATRVLALPGGDGAADVVVDGGVRPATAGVEVWQLPGSGLGRVAVGAPLDVAGDAGTTADLTASGVLGPRAVRLVEDGAAVLSDSAYRRDVDQREAVDPDGPALAASQGREVVPPGAAAPPTASRLVSGAEAVTASSSAAEATGDGRRPGAEPLAAVDGNAFTVWQSRPGVREGQWWQLELDAPRRVFGTTVQVVQNVYGGQLVTRVRVDTDAGGREVDVAADGRLVLDDPGPTSRLRITAVAFSGSSPRDAFAIAEVVVPGVTVREELVVPRSSASTWVLAARPASRTRCVPAVPLPGRPTAEPATVCDPSLSVRGRDVGSLDRVLPVPEAGPVTGRAWVRAPDTVQAAAVADGLADPSVTATATSVAAQDLVTRAQAAADGDPGTAWRAAPSDEEPALTLAWPERARISGLRLVLPDDGLSARPGRVRVQATGAGTGGAAPRAVERRVEEDGAVRFPAVRARGVTVTLLDLEGPTSLDSVTAAQSPTAAAVAEVEVDGAPATTYDADAVRTLRCGLGPEVRVGGTSVRTSVRTSARDLVEGRPVAAVLCDRPQVAAGETPVSVEATFTWLPLGLVLSRSPAAVGEVDDDRPAGGTSGPAPLEVDADAVAHRWSSVDLPVPGPGTRTVVLAVPAGTGFAARADGVRLRSVTVDGWAQGWVVPEGIDRVSLDYSAGASLRTGAGLGLLGWLAVLGVLVLPRSRNRRDQSRVGRSTQA
ncbi:4-amino-4-deoxy-L-arabinose transferase-like glycosyltransferase [Nocardioides aurantiacus]|uniref:4-amino-4-deoxy-L-arabinose transferase-like glycosyltransferase n=1 Tax=Nocardioides aurantiacus TaxID=86796 RepID=A0A3N2CW47_9ACTN|nr:4-amino-4-deoxy-L-arabinose transferase-like glycosyltransferase [Nocardioides aurantiacus]